MVWIAQPPRSPRGLVGTRPRARRRDNAPSGLVADRALAPAPGQPVLVQATRRQLECLAWVAAGKTAPEIGTILGLSPRTVETHLARLCEALGVRKRIQAVERAISLGLIQGSP